MLIDSYSRPSVCISVMCVVLKQSIFFIDFVPCSHQSVSSGILRHLPSSQKIFQFQCLWNSAVAIGAMHRSSNGRMNQKGFQQYRHRSTAVIIRTVWHACQVSYLALHL